MNVKGKRRRERKGWGTYEGSELLLHAVSDTGEHGCSSREHDVSVQVLADVDITLHDGVVCGLVDSCGLHTQEGGLEEGLGATETLVTDGDHLSVGKLCGETSVTDQEETNEGRERRGKEKGEITYHRTSRGLRRRQQSASLARSRGRRRRASP